MASYLRPLSHNPRGFWRLAITALAANAPLNVLGVDVNHFDSYDHAIEQVALAVASRKKTFWAAVNPQKVYRALHDPKLLAALRQADARICDGIGVSIAVRMLHGRTIHRCTGCDLFFHLIAAAAERGWRVFLLGASPEANALACEKLQRRHVGLQVVGRADGFFRDSAQVLQQIADAQPDLLFVAMGSPKQEFWITQNRREITAPFCLGVGGSFDVASGLVARAPKVFQKTGTEFLYQLAKQPWRWKRQIIYFPYMMHVLKETFRRRAAGAQS